MQCTRAKVYPPCSPYYDPIQDPPLSKIVAIKYAPFRTQLPRMIRLPGNRVIRDPGLDTLPEDVFGQVGRETTHDGLETFRTVRDGLRSGFVLFLLAGWFGIGRRHRWVQVE